MTTRGIRDAAQAQGAVHRWIADLNAQLRQGTPVAQAAAPRLDTTRARSRGRGKSPRSLALIEAALAIYKEIQPASVRAGCYRLFTLGLIASMAKPETNRVSTQLTWAREHGLIPWEFIVDETREPKRVTAWENPAAFIETVQRSYRRDRWTDQPERLEVWSEKGTVSGTLAPVLNAYGVTARVMHGYPPHQ